MGHPIIEDKRHEMRAGKGVGFERIRRITGYLVGSMDKWNESKKAEESQRVKHDISRFEGKPKE